MCITLSRLGCCFALATLVPAGTCLAQYTAARDARLFRLAPMSDQLLRTARVANVWTAEYSFGAAHTEFDGGGHAFNTPASLVLTRGLYTLTFATDGYTRLSTDGLEGLSDILVIGGKTLWENDAADRSLSGTLGLSIPTRGDVGSRKTAEFLSLAYSFSPAANVGLTTSAQLYRDESVASDNENPYSQTLGVLLARKLSADRNVFLQFVSSHANGFDWQHTIVAGYDFPLRTTTASLAISHGLSSDAHHSTFEFQIFW